MENPNKYIAWPRNKEHYNKNHDYHRNRRKAERPA